MPADADWRRRGQEAYLQGAKLYRIRFQPCSGEWDHEHCAFCSEKFSLTDGDLKEGYCTTPKNAEGSHWICPECFADFVREFGWTTLE